MLFFKKPRPLRVKAFSVAGSGGWEKYQLLQERRWWGWKTIDREDVPRDVVISVGCFGDTGGWRSKFASLGPFDRTGIIRPAESR